VPKSIFKISVDTDNFTMLSDLSKQANLSKSDLVNLLLSDYFNLTNRMGLIRDILIDHEINKMKYR